MRLKLQDILFDWNSQKPNAKYPTVSKSDLKWRPLPVQHKNLGEQKEGEIGGDVALRCNTWMFWLQTEKNDIHPSIVFYV